VSSSVFWAWASMIRADSKRLSADINKPRRTESKTTPTQTKQ
jgi:hypothetical protein